MNWIFLEMLTLGNNDQIYSDFSDTSMYSGFGNAMIGAIIGVIAVYLIILFGGYIYLSIAYSGIGKKAKLSNPGVAWIPGMGPIAVIFETAKAHWWPFPIMTIGYVLGYLIFTWGFLTSMFGEMSAMFIIGAIILILTFLLFLIIWTLWHWKTYVTVGSPGWFAIVPMIGLILGIALNYLSPITGIIIVVLSAISHLVFIGIAAWGSGTSKNQ
jgi:hypothetical protein